MDFETPTLELYARGLNHADPYIRNECLDLICTSPELSVAHSRAVLEQLAVNDSDAYACFHRVIDRFPHDATTLKQLFELCTQWARSGAVAPSYAAYCLRWCLNTEAALHGTVQQALDEVEPALIGALGIDVLRKELQRIQQITQWDEAATLKEVEGLKDAFALPDDSTMELNEWLKRLCRHLAHIMPRPEITALTKKWLGLASENSNFIQTTCALYLCGILSLEDTAPQILELCENSFGDWEEEIEEAFILMNSQSALQLIQARWDTLDEVTQSCLCDVYQGLVLPHFDPFYCSRLERKIDEYDDCEFYTKEGFARAYISSGSQQALDDCQQFIEQYDIEADHHEGFKLIVTLYTHTILRDYKPERLDNLRRRLSAFNSAPSDLDLDTDDLGWLQDYDDDEITLPLRKEPKIGRNEPCPCGSGKKYKKCCL